MMSNALDPTGSKPTLYTHSVSTKYAPAPTTKQPPSTTDCMQKSPVGLSSDNTVSTDRGSLCTQFCNCITTLFNAFIACLKNLFCCQNAQAPNPSASSRQNNPNKTFANTSCRTTTTQKPKPLTNKPVKPVENITQEQFPTRSAPTPEQFEKLIANLTEKQFLALTSKQLEQLNEDQLRKLTTTKKIATKPYSLDNINKFNQQIGKILKTIFRKQTSDTNHMEESFEQTIKISNSVKQLNLTKPEFIACLQGAKHLIPQEIITLAENLPDDSSYLSSFFFDPRIAIYDDRFNTLFPPTPDGVEKMKQILRNNILPFATEVQRLAQEKANQCQQKE